MNALTMTSRWAWTSYWQLMRRYHRFEVHGLEHVLRLRGPAMLVGYHGKPGARDLIMLQTLLWCEHGELTHAIAHDMAFTIPGVRAIGDGLMMLRREPQAIADVVARGEKLVVTPGGIAEAWGSFRDRDRVQWKGIGYLRLAARLGLPIIPVAGVGTDDAFIGLYNGYRLWKPLWDALHLPPGAGVWMGLGPMGVWPFTPPFPARIVQHIGAPIHLADEGVAGPDDDPRLTRVHERLVATVQGMLDQGRARARGRAAVGEESAWVDQITA